MTIRESCERNKREAEDFFSERGSSPQSFLAYVREIVLKDLGLTVKTFFTTPFCIVCAALVIVGLIDLIIDVIALLVN